MPRAERRGKQDIAVLEKGDEGNSCHAINKVLSGLAVVKSEEPLPLHDSLDLSLSFANLQRYSVPGADSCSISFLEQVLQMLTSFKALHVASSSTIPLVVPSKIPVPLSNEHSVSIVKFEQHQPR